MAQKLSDADVGNIRQQAALGRSVSEIAGDFGVSRRHTARIIRGTARPQLGGLDRDLVEVRGVRASVDRFLGGLELTAGQQVLAATAAALADKLDALGTSDTAGAAAAAPQVAGQLVDLVRELRGDDHQPDKVDELVARREARRLASASSRSAEGSP